MPMECRHILPGGRKCGAIALRGGIYCYFHTRLHRRTDQRSRADRSGKESGPAQPPLEIPVLEDRSAIQLLIPDVLNALLAGKIDGKAAAILLNGMRLAAQNADKSIGSEPTRTVEVFSHTPDGHLLALFNDEFSDDDDCNEGELIGKDDAEIPELPSPSKVPQLPGPAVVAQSIEACARPADAPIVPPLVSARSQSPKSRASIDV